MCAKKSTYFQPQAAEHTANDTVSQASVPKWVVAQEEKQSREEKMRHAKAAEKNLAQEKKSGKTLTDMFKSDV